MSDAANRSLVMGAVAYAPKVVTIWDGFKRWFADHGFPFDYVLYSNYERMVEDLLEGQLDVAWNSPLAWVRAQRLASARGVTVRALVMRDTDCDLTSVIVVPTDGPITAVAELAGRTLAVGAPDSPQATLLPLHQLRLAGIDPDRDLSVQVFDVLGGKHGDHVGGEQDAASALAAGDVDAACLLELNYRAFEADGTLPPGATRVIARTAPFDHCNFTAVGTAPVELVERFAALLVGMSPDDPEVKPLLDLEGLRRWVPARLDGYRALELAVDEAGFYDQSGAITAAGYRY
jgi:phosphonate transport system substrate-binding protein